MPWIQIAFTTTQELAAQLSDILSECGAASVTFEDAADDPILEPGVGETPLWKTTIVTALFDAKVDTQQILQQAKSAIAPQSLPEHRISPLEDKVWEREWMKDFHAMRFGRRTWICPSWETPPDKEAVNILLDPGLAFGTGTHATTALCLEWLDENVSGGETIVDFGCGSGVLAIGALMHGAAQAYAIDNDPQALQATRDNAEKNQVLDRLKIVPADKSLAINADIVIANILAKPLTELAATIAGYTGVNGMAVLSGILPDQQQTVIDAYTPWFRVKHIAIRDQWVRLDLQQSNDAS